MFLVLSCSGLCAIYWSQLLSGESRGSWSSANRRCTNYIWVINNFIAYKGVTYIKYLMVGCHDVVTLSNSLTWCYPGTMITKFNWCHVTLQLINIFFNSLAPGRFEWNFRYIIFKRILVIDDGGISCQLALIWMSLDFTDDQSTLVQVMLGAVRQQAITRANIDQDLCQHMASLGHNELINTSKHKTIKYLRHHNSAFIIYH